MTTPLTDNLQDPHNWTEDYLYGEEGKTKINCSICGIWFLGWKLKTKCRVCAIPICPVDIRHITHVAIRYGDNDHSVTYSLPAPNRHYHVLRIVVADETFINNDTETQGFLDNDGIFLNRKDALEVALKANQVIDINNIRARQLFSEDLW